MRRCCVEKDSSPRGSPRHIVPRCTHLDTHTEPAKAKQCKCVEIGKSIKTWGNSPKGGRIERQVYRCAYKKGGSKTFLSLRKVLCEGRRSTTEAENRGRAEWVCASVFGEALEESRCIASGTHRSCGMRKRTEEEGVKEIDANRRMYVEGNQERCVRVRRRVFEPDHCAWFRR